MQFRVIIVLIASALCFNYLPQIEIDLNGSPKDRWREAVRTVLSLYGYDNSFGPVFEFHNQHTFAVLEPQDYVTIGQAVRRNFPEYSLELEGVIEELNRTDITFEYMAAWAYFHEIGHISSSNSSNDQTECTGVLLSFGDQIIHGRNMDQAPGQARNMVLHLIFKKDGKYIGETVDWYWFKTGYITLLKYNVATLEENWRLPTITKDQAMEFIQQGVPSVTWVYREILVNDTLNTYQNIVEYLEQNTVACALYNIIGGIQKNQGVIISRDPFETLPTLNLEDQGQGNNEYTYLVQTNYDHWLPDPEYDNRRTVAEDLLSQIQNNLLNDFGIYAIMDTYPIHNEDTFLTVIMNAKQNKFITFGQPSITLTDE